MRRVGYHHGDLRNALLDAVAGIVAERGAWAVSLREAARRAGVSHGAYAHHYGDKRSLLTAFAVQGYERLGEHLARALERERPADARAWLQTLGVAYVAFAVAEPERFAVMWHTDLTDPDDPVLKASSDRVWAALSEAVDRCVAEGAVAADRRDATIVAAWALVHGIAELWSAGRLRLRTGGADPVALARSVTQLFVEGVIGPRLG